jgi:hypothetical protein
VSLLLAVLGHSLVEILVRIVGVALLAGVATTIATFVYRVRVRNKLPEGATLILGLGIVAIYLNTRSIFIQFIGESNSLPTVGEATINVTIFIVAGIASYGGHYAGDKIAMSDRLSLAWLQPDFSPIVRAAGRFITVTLPEEIDDIEGYDPVGDETKEVLQDRALDFPRGLTVSELQSQLSLRLKEEYDIGYVDIELATDGTVDYLAVGRRAAGIGPTLPPNTAAVAVDADPPFSATPGDTVQLWYRDDDGEKRLGAAELRASVGSVATVVTDEAIATQVDPATTYRLMTLSADSNPEREFAAMLRRGDETMSILAVRGDGPLVGAAIGSLDVTVIAVQSPGGTVETIPKRDRVIQDGDDLFAIGRPDTLRKLESSAGVQVVEAGDELLEAAVSPRNWNGGTR